MRVLYVTSFNEVLYKADGHRLVDSFLRHRAEEQFLLCCYEGTGYCPSWSTAGLIGFPLSQDPFCRSWSEKYRETCKKADSWNKNAFRWFRKIASIRRGSLDYGHTTDYLVWLDCDCVFLRQISYRFWAELFQDISLLYLHGPRNFPENGFIGFNMKLGGAAFIEAYAARYESGRFLQDTKWDDCNQLMYTMRELRRGRKFKDIATTCSTFNGSNTCVFPNSPLGAYLEHYKGNHTRVLKVVE